MTPTPHRHSAPTNAHPLSLGQYLALRDKGRLFFSLPHLLDVSSDHSVPRIMLLGNIISVGMVTLPPSEITLSTVIAHRFFPRGWPSLLAVHS